MGAMLPFENGPIMNRGRSRVRQARYRAPDRAVATHRWRARTRHRRTRAGRRRRVRTPRATARSRERRSSSIDDRAKDVEAEAPHRTEIVTHFAKRPAPRHLLQHGSRPPHRDSLVARLERRGVPFDPRTGLKLRVWPDQTHLRYTCRYSEIPREE